MKQSSQHQHKWSWQKSVVIAFLACAVSSAWAQYVWIDDKGVKQFSDTPPPPNTPKNRIIKGPVPATPEKIRATVNQDSAASASAVASASAKAEPPTMAERNAEFNKRRQEQAEKEKKEAAEAERRLAQQRQCDAARAWQRDLDSGVRIGQVDKNGERSFLTDEQRAQNTRENRKILDGCK